MTINEAVFSENFKAMPQYANLLNIFRESSTFVAYINQYAAANGRIELGASGQGTRLGANSVIVDPNHVPESGGAGSYTLTAFASFLGHELGHATQLSGNMYNGQGAAAYAAATNPAQAGQVGLTAEGVALVAEYRIASELGTRMGGGTELQQVFDSLAIQNGGANSQQFYDMAVTAGAAHTATRNPSIAPLLTYREYYEESWALQKCRVDVSRLDWKNTTSSDVSVAFDGTTNVCTFDTTTIKGLDGTSYQLRGTFNSSGGVEALRSIIVPPAGRAIATVIGNETLNINNADIQVGFNASVTIEGQNNYISSDGNASISVYGNNTIDTDNSLVYVESGSEIDLIGDWNEVLVEQYGGLDYLGHDNFVQIDNNGTINYSGYSNTMNFWGTQQNIYRDYQPVYYGLNDSIYDTAENMLNGFYYMMYGNPKEYNSPFVPEPVGNRHVPGEAAENTPIEPALIIGSQSLGSLVGAELMLD